MVYPLLPCPFCGTADPSRGDYRGNSVDGRSGRTITCRESTCQAYMFRARCWYDDAHTRLETTEELDAALAVRWNRRANSEVMAALDRENKELRARENERVKARFARQAPFS